MPSQVSIKVRALSVHVQLEAALTAACEGIAASLARSGAEHGSARNVLERFRADGDAMLTMLRRSLRHASSA
eukprot:1443859-Prymnesium_polylepis.1